MAFNGSGTFVRLYNWVQDKANNIKILAARMDAEMDGFATGLSTCITKDGQTTPTADLTLGNFKFTNAGKATGYNQYMTAEQVIENEFVYYTTSGTDTYTITPSPSITAYTAGLGLKIKIGTTNTTTATLNVNALGAKTIKTPSGANVVAGELPSGAIVDVVYDGTNFVISQYQSKVAAFTSGAIDGTVIGGTTRAAISATTGDFNALITAPVGINPNSSGGTTLTAVNNNRYTPTLTNTTNVAASTAIQCQYARINDICWVSGAVAIDPTAAGATVLEMSLPIASNFSSVRHCGGVATTSAVAGIAIAIEANSTNDTANFSFIAVDTSNRTFQFSFMYWII